MLTKLLSPVKSATLILISALIVSYFNEESFYNIFKIVGLYTILEVACFFIVAASKNRALGKPKVVYSNSKYYVEVSKRIRHFFLVEDKPYENLNRILIDVSSDTEELLEDNSPLIKAFVIAILESQNWSMKDVLEAELFEEQHSEELKMARDFVETVG